MKESGIFRLKTLIFVYIASLIVLVIFMSGCRAIEILRGDDDPNQVISDDGAVTVKFREPKPYEISISPKPVSEGEGTELFLEGYQFKPFGRVLDFDYDMELHVDRYLGSETIDDLRLFIYMPEKGVWIDTDSELDPQKFEFSTSQRYLSSFALVKDLGLKPPSSLYDLRDEILDKQPDGFVGYESGFAYSLDGVNFIGVDAGYLNFGCAHDLKAGGFKVEEVTVQSQENIGDFSGKMIYWKAYVVWSTGSLEKSYVEGYVRSRSGDPVGEVNVSFFNNNTNEEHQEVSDSDGYYATYLNDGNYTILALADDGRYIEHKALISTYSFNRSLVPSKHINEINLTLHSIDRWKGKLNLTGELEHPTDIVHMDIKIDFDFNIDSDGTITGKGKGTYLDIEVEPKIEGIFYFIEEAPDFEVTIMGRKEAGRISLAFKADSRIIASIQSPQVGTVSEAEPMDWLSPFLLSARLNEVSFPILDGASAKIGSVLGDASFSVESLGEIEIFINDSGS